MLLSRIQPSQKGGILVLGMFDGVHAGHQALLHRAEQYGQHVTVCTFDRHPLEVLQPSGRVELLTTVTRRAALMAHYGVDETVLLPFTPRTASIAPEDFLNHITCYFEPERVIVGYNYTFGAHGAGHPEDIQHHGKLHGYSVDIMPPLQMDGKPVSSTRIRLLLKNGNVKEAVRLLNHEWVLTGRIVDRESTEEGPAVTVCTDARLMLPATGNYACLSGHAGRTSLAEVRVENPESARIRLFCPEAKDLVPGSCVRIAFS